MTFQLFIMFLAVTRFYFVGDEDLLEIIGNSKSVPKLQKHFKKMFAGVASVILSEDGTQVLGISSREGEQVSMGDCIPQVRGFFGFVFSSFVECIMGSYG